MILTKKDLKKLIKLKLKKINKKEIFFMKTS